MSICYYMSTQHKNQYKILSGLNPDVCLFSVLGLGLL